MFSTFQKISFSFLVTFICKCFCFGLVLLKKFLEISIFSFSHNVFYLSKNKFQLFWSHSSANAFALEWSNFFLFGKVLTLSQTSPGFYMFLENTVGKGEITHNKHFLLFPQCLLPICRTVCHFHQI